MDQNNENSEADTWTNSPQTCQEPGQDEWVYAYYDRDLDADGEQAFEEHLLGCDRCQKVLLLLDWAYTEMRSNPERFSSPEPKGPKRRATMKAKSNNV